MNNGMNGAMRLIGWTVGIISLLITIYLVFHVPLVNAIANEASLRAIEDTLLRKEISAMGLENSKEHGDIKGMLTEIKTELKYFHKEVK